MEMKLISQLASLFRRPKTQRVWVRVPEYSEDWGEPGENWVQTEVPNPTTFSELNEMFGEGNWAL
jgi:hypothetical protein